MSIAPGGSDPKPDLEVRTLETQARIERRAGRRFLVLATVVTIYLALLGASNVVSLVLVYRGLTERDRTIAAYQSAVPQLTAEIVRLETQVRQLGGTPAPFTLQITPKR